MPDTGRAKNLSIFTLKNVTCRTYLISFIVQYCFLFRFVCIELVSLIWFLQIWVAIYVYGTMINWSTLIKKLMQTYIVIVSGSILNVSTVHLNGIWHLIWRYLSKPVLGGGPQVGEVTWGGLPHPTCKRDHIKMRDYVDWRVTPPKRVNSPIWGTPPPCKQVLRWTPCIKRTLQHFPRVSA